MNESNKLLLIEITNVNISTRINYSNTMKVSSKDLSQTAKYRTKWLFFYLFIENYVRRYVWKLKKKMFKIIIYWTLYDNYFIKNNI